MIFLIFVLFSLFYLILGRPTQPNPDCICPRTQTDCQCDSHWVSPLSTLHHPGYLFLFNTFLTRQQFDHFYKQTLIMLLSSWLTKSLKFASFVRRGPRETEWLCGARTASPVWNVSWQRSATWSARDWRLPVRGQPVLLQSHLVTEISNIKH